MKIFKVLLLAIILSSCSSTQDQQTAKSETFVFKLWVTRVDVCNQVVNSVEQKKVLFAMNKGVFGFIVDGGETLVLIHQYTWANPDGTFLQVFRSDVLEEMYCVDIRPRQDGLLIFVSPIITKEFSCATRIATTSYVFSTHKPGR